MHLLLHKSRMALLASALLFPLNAPAQSADKDVCSDATLKGDFAFTITGQILPPGQPPISREGVAMTHFDGQGNLTQVDYLVANGAAVSGPTDPVTGFHTDETGTYKVFSDCTGEAEIRFPAPPAMSSGVVIDLKFVLSNHGRRIHTIVTKLVPPGSSIPVPASIHSDAEKVALPRDNKEE